MKLPSKWHSGTRLVRGLALGLALGMVGVTASGCVATRPAAAESPVVDASERSPWAHEPSHVQMEVYMGSVPVEHLRDHR